MKRFWILLTALIAIKTFAATSVAASSLPLPTITHTLPFPGVNDTLISVPQLYGGLVLGISGYYLQPVPTNGDLDYVQINTNTIPPNDGQKIKRVNPGYDTGWGASVGYIFPNTGNDANVNYYHLGATDSNAIRGAGFILFNPAAGLIGPTTAHAQAEYTLNQVDVTAGQFINVGKEVVLHPRAGVRWAEICRQIFGHVTNDNGETVSIINIEEFSNFHGLGPVLGLDATYKIVYGLNFVGHFDTALLLGYINAHTTSNDLVNSVEVINEFSEDDLTRVVPMTDLKLGFNYVFVMDIPTNSDLTLEAGWQSSEFYNAVDRIYGSAIGEQGSARDNKLSNMGVSGPYIKIVFRGRL